MSISETKKLHSLLFPSECVTALSKCSYTLWWTSDIQLHTLTLWLNYFTFYFLCEWYKCSAAIHFYDFFFFQVLDSLFGSHLSSLILAPARTDDTAEGSSRPHHSSSSSLIQGPMAGHSATKDLPGKKAAVPQFFLDFLKRQSKMRRRGRTSMVGGRGCFGMKMDRIGSISGLGC